LLEPDELGTIAGLERPADLADLGPRLVSRLGANPAARVSSGSLIEGLGRLLPA
jgi:hypothetical protein